MKRIISIALSILVVLILITACTSEMESPVLSVADLIEACMYSDTIVLEADLDIYAAGYNSTNPLQLNLYGKTLDLNGHSIKGIVCNSITGNGDKGYQVSDCSLKISGSDFTIKNGTFVLGDCKYPIIMTINAPTVSENTDSYKKSHVYGNNPKNKGIRIENITCMEGGFTIYDSEITFSGCTINQPKLSLGYSISTITGLFSQIRITSGTYNNYQTISLSYPRWLKLFYSSAWAYNGVKHNIESSHYQYVEDSMFYLEKSSVGSEVSERK